MEYDSSACSIDLWNLLFTTTSLFILRKLIDSSSFLSPVLLSFGFWKPYLGLYNGTVLICFLRIVTRMISFLKKETFISIHKYMFLVSLFNFSFKADELCPSELWRTYFSFINTHTYSQIIYLHFPIDHHPNRRRSNWRQHLHSQVKCLILSVRLQ